MRTPTRARGTAAATSCPWFVKRFGRSRTLGSKARQIQRIAETMPWRRVAQCLGGPRPSAPDLYAFLYLALAVCVPDLDPDGAEKADFIDTCATAGATVWDERCRWVAQVVFETYAPAFDFLNGVHVAGVSELRLAALAALIDLDPFRDGEQVRQGLRTGLALYLSPVYVPASAPGEADLLLARLYATYQRTPRASAGALRESWYELSKARQHKQRQRQLTTYNTYGRVGDLPIPVELCKLKAGDHLARRVDHVEAARSPVAAYTQAPFQDLNLMGKYELLTGKMLKFAQSRNRRRRFEARVRFIVVEPFVDCWERACARALPLLFVHLLSEALPGLQVIRAEVVRGNDLVGFQRHVHELTDLPIPDLLLLRAGECQTYFRHASSGGRPLDRSIRGPEPYFVVGVDGDKGLPRDVETTGPAVGMQYLRTGRRFVAEVRISDGAAAFYGPGRNPETYSVASATGSGLLATQEMERLLRGMLSLYLAKVA